MALKDVGRAGGVREERRGAQGSERDERGHFDQSRRTKAEYLPLRFRKR